MPYFEFKEPYTAIIKANDVEDAVNKYIENVAGDESEREELRQECSAIPAHYANALYSRAIGNDGELIKIEEVLEVLESGKSELLLMDATLVL